MASRTVTRPRPFTLARTLVLTISVLLFSTLSSAATSAASTPSPPPTATIPDRALLAFDKAVSGDLVAGRNVTVTYTVLNVGKHPATDITLRDSSFPASRFLLADGQTARTSWATVSPGETLTHSVTVEPKRSGYLYISPPSLSYIDQLSGDKHVSKIAGTDSLVVEDLLEYRRRTDRHTSTWIIYIVAFVMLGIGPFAVSEMMAKSLSPTNSQKKSH